MLLIGSHALIHRSPQLPTRLQNQSPVDFDYIATIDEYESYVKELKNSGRLKCAYPVDNKTMVVVNQDETIVEFSIAWEGTSNQLILEYEGDNTIASLATLLMLKLSHRYLRNSPHFLKTMSDIRFLRTKTELTPRLKEILKIREKETYNYSHPKLNQSKNDFFDSSVKYVYEHDDIHEAVAVDARPAYTFFKKDGAEVQMSKKKFNALEHRVKINAGLEESYVLAIERSLVPHGTLTPYQAFSFALMKVCTSITSGWFREFCWENYEEIRENYSEEFYHKFQIALAKGKIRKAQND